MTLLEMLQGQDGSHLEETGGLEPAIAPLERFIAPPHLDGRTGTHRCRTGCQIPADNDVAAIHWWTSQASNNESTARSRRSAAEKLLNWACFSRRKAVSSFDESDFAAFARFLAHPEPADMWIGTHQLRESMTWKPFTRPLTGHSRDLVLRHVSALVRWLSSQRYAELRFLYGKRATDDGHATIAVRGATRLGQRPEPLSISEWHWVRRLLDAAYPAVDLAVQRAVVELLYYGDLYVEEVAGLELRDCEPPNRFAPGWSIRVPSRSMEGGGRTVFAPPPLSDTLQRWVSKLEMPRNGYVTLRIRACTQSLLDADGPTLARKARQVLRLAAGLALERSDVPNGLRLRDRTLTSFRGAFEAHQRPRPVNRNAIDLTGRFMDFGLRLDDRRPPRWDWSRAAHLWTEDKVANS